MTPVIRCAPGVTFTVIAPGGFRLLAAIDLACWEMARDLTLTAGTDHHESGRHPLGEAYDLSVKGLSPLDILRLVQFLRARLGSEFSVFYETKELPPEPALQPVSLVNAHATGPHIHAQVKLGVQYGVLPAPLPDGTVRA